MSLGTSATTAVRELSPYIDGRFVVPRGNEVVEVTSPATGSHIANVALPGAEEVRLAATAARRAQAVWAEVGPWQRAAVCHRVADAIDARVDELARLHTLEQGKPLAESVADIREAAQLYHLHAEDMMRLHGETMRSSDPHKRMFTFYRPVGTWAIITPWNFPVLMMAEFVAPGLATGNAHVVKPPAHTCMTVLATLECFEEAGVPPGLVNVLPGDAEVGKLLVEEDLIDAIGFIGSSATGAAIQSRAGLKRTVMECSGNGPLVVCADANVARAAKAAVYGAYFCAGQVCCATERVLVHKSVHDEFVEAAVGEASKVRLGDPFDPGTTLGPLNNEAVASKMDRHLADARERGATVLTGGGRHLGAPTPLYYELTVIDKVHQDMLVAREESFGPVVPVLTAGSDAELLEIANRDPLGLQGAVFTESTKRAFFFMERMRAGQVIVNDTTGWWDINMPFGGAGGTKTGWGRIGGRHTLMEMSDLRTGVIDLS
ncbi:MAG: aldehyde dehydrogenase family protein [Acidimicrobiales bacterium]